LNPRALHPRLKSIEVVQVWGKPSPPALDSAESECPRVARGACRATRGQADEGLAEHDFGPVSDPCPAPSMWHTGGTHLHCTGCTCWVLEQHDRYWLCEELVPVHGKHLALCTP
jgi:hypothetical protein